jgi:hypothetical protein
VAPPAGTTVPGAAPVAAAPGATNGVGTGAAALIVVAMRETIAAASLTEGTVREAARSASSRATVVAVDAGECDDDVVVDACRVMGG